MSALDGGTWGLGARFDQLTEKLFEIADKEGVLLSIRVRKNPARLRCVTPKPAKKRAKRA